MSSPLRPPRSPALPPALDFAFLRQKGIGHIERLAGKVWTDYNLHDPGITILEVLCYALVDLGYRTRNRIPDLLARPYTQQTPLADTFYPPHCILSSRPVSQLDQTRLLLDLPGVLGVNFNPPGATGPATPGRGLQRLQVHLQDGGQKEDIRRDIRGALRQYRSLGEDLADDGDGTGADVTFLHHDEIEFRIDLEVNLRSDLEDMLRAVAEALRAYVAPAPQFLDLDALQKMNLPTDGFFNGPLLTHGFFLPQRLSPDKLYAADIVERLMALDGVKLVRHLRMTGGGTSENPWIYRVPAGKVACPNLARSVVRLYHKSSLVGEHHLDAFAEQGRYFIKQNYRPMRFSFPGGNYLNLAAYASIQDDFPEVYGIGRRGLAGSESPARKAAAAQLQGYLLFFEQLSANFLAQVNHLPYLFSPTPTKHTYASQLITDVPGARVLLGPLLFPGAAGQDLPALSEGKPIPKAVLEAAGKRLEEITESKHAFLRRRNRVLDHLLARFGLSTTGYAAALPRKPGYFQQLIAYKEALLADAPGRNGEREQPGPVTYGTTGERSGGINPATYRLSKNQPCAGVERTLYGMLGIRDRTKRLLSRVVTDGLRSTPPGTGAKPWWGSPVTLHADPERLYRDLFGNLTDAKRYTVEAHPDGGWRVQWSEANAGEPEPFFRLEHAFPSREDARQAARDLADHFAGLDASSEGLHVVDHVLLRPRTRGETAPGPCYDGALPDPYTFVVTVVLPDWPSRFRDPTFRQFITDTIYRELPAHLVVNVRWFSHAQMKQFENGYDAWLGRLNQRLKRRDAGEELPDADEKSREDLARQLLEMLAGEAPEARPAAEENQNS